MKRNRYQYGSLTLEETDIMHGDRIIFKVVENNFGKNNEMYMFSREEVQRLNCLTKIEGSSTDPLLL